MKLEFSRHTFEKCSNSRYHENPSSGSRVGPCGRTDRHDEAHSGFSKFCELAWKNIKIMCRCAFFCPVVGNDITFPHRTSSVNRILIYCRYKYLWSYSTFETWWAHAQKPYLAFQRNGPVHLNRQGCQFSRLLAAEECESADSNCIDRVPTYNARLLATHSIRIFPLHFPSRSSPCAIRFWTRYA